MVSLDNLIRNGYFPSQLPPPFNTEDLANSLSVILPSHPTRSKWTRYCRYSIPKVCYQRRILGIPNPYSHLLLCDFISNKWPDLNRYMLGSRFSLSRTVIDDSNERALKRRYSFSDLIKEKITRSIGYNYLLYSDISRFYSTIYTHSIPWALHLKSVAKNNTGPSLYGNTIDKYVRWSNDGQTIGIPIGPDTSLLISEVIGTAIDKFFKNKIKNFKGFRYVDDFFLYFKTKQEAQNALTILQSVLREFELETNTEKTKIIELPEILLEYWVSELSRFSFRNSVEGEKTDIVRYFSKTFELCKEFPDKYVIRYSISRIKELLFRKENWSIYESFLMESAIAEPGSLPVITRILLAYQTRPDYTLNISRIKKTITELIMTHGPHYHNFEVAWALWLSKSLNINLDRKAAKIVSKMNDPISALIALDMYNSGIISHGKLSTSNWLNFMTGRNLYEENWILSYEALIKNWLPSKTGTNYIAIDRFFSLLESNNVSFYNSARQVETIVLQEPVEEIRPLPRIILRGELPEDLHDQLQLILRHYEY